MCCEIVDLATREFGTVFVDLPTNWTNWSLSLVARSDLVLLVTELTVAGLNRARRQLRPARIAGPRRRSTSASSSTASKRRMARTIGLADVAQGARPRRRLHRRQRFPADARGDRSRRPDRGDQAQDARLARISTCSTPGLRRRWDWSGRACGRSANRPSRPTTDEQRGSAPLEEHRLVTVGDAGAFAKRDKHTELKVELHQRLLDLINLQALDQMSREQIEAEVGDIVAEELAKQNHALNHAERKQLVGDVLDELLGLGPLEPLLKDPTITDILVNGHDSVFVERYGVLEPSPVRFKDETAPAADHPEDRLGGRPADRRILADGRCAPRRRKPRQRGRPAAGARRLAAVDPQIRAGADQHGPADRDRQHSRRRSPKCLKAIVGSRRNVLISGGTGSGKTTLLNAMSAFIDDRERIVTIEDSAELQLQQEHVVRLETRPPNIEGKGEIAQRDLVKNALRMRPDRIIVGEVRAGEAFDMLQAMNTGHDGSMTTVHANYAARCAVPRRADDRHERDRHPGALGARADRLGDQRRHPGRAAGRRPAQARSACRSSPAWKAR